MKKSDIRQSHWLGLVNIHLDAINYQNIPSGLKVIPCIQPLKTLPRRGYLKRNLTLDYLNSQVLSIFICMPNVIKVFLSVL